MNAKHMTLRNGLLAILAAAPLAASAQVDADLAVTVAHLGTLTYGQTKTYSVKVTNLGPSTAQGVELAFPVVDSRLEIAGVTGCTLSDSFDPATDTTAIHPNLPGSWPCKILANIPDPVLSGTTLVAASASVHVDVTWTEFVATVCPTDAPAIVLGPSTFSVSSTVSTDPNAANDTVRDTPGVAPLANLGIAMTTPVTEGGGGTQFTVTTVVTNAGPCASRGVKVVDNDGVSDIKMSFVSSSGCFDPHSLPTTQVPVTTADPVAGCALDDMASGATKTITSTYIVGDMASDELQRATIVNYDVLSSPPKVTPAIPATLDPDTTDNVASVSIGSSQSVSTCATGGIPAPLGLLALGLLALRRRRT